LREAHFDRPGHPRAGYQTLAPHAHTLATYEGFEAHANAVSALRN
jgi:histidinol dehydrogenase